jgi:hypothetical protein
LGSGREFSQNQADIIDVVGMMFDFILDDPELPVAVKGVLARLQIPMLKVALLDRNFFGKKSHPARLLLNELARAGMGLDEVADVTTSPVFGKIELIVGRILQEFDDDLLLFAELRQELQEFYTQEQAQLEQVRITLEQSHATASEAMAPLLAVDILPDAVRELLEGAWSEHLVELYRASGSKCEAWQRAAALATTLVDSLQPKQGAVERKALARLLPSLLVDLRRFSVVANLPAEESQRFFKALEECHLEGLRSREVEKPATPTASLKPVAEQRAGKPVLLEAEQVRQTAGRVMSAKELGTLLDDLPLPAPTSTRQQPVMAPAEEVASAVLMQAESEDSAAADQTAAATTSADKGPFTEEIVMSSEMPAGQEEDRQWAEQYATYASMARELEVGSWLNFTDENGRVRRGKLAWKSVVMGEYVFVDRFFKVVRDINLQQLVTALANGQVSLADEKPLMDRALDSVMSALKKYQDKVGGQAASQD